MKPDLDTPERRDGDQERAALLVSVGERVRLLRSRSGLTRRRLAARAGVSERRLSDLESGRANPTLGILARVAAALDTSIGAFLPQDTPSPLSRPLHDLLAAMTPAEQQAAYRLLLRSLASTKHRHRGVALIGLRGAGKTTLGRKVAKACRVPFLRLSEVIQERSGMEIGELLEMVGPAAYRRFEFEALEHVIATCPKAIVEAGGGLVLEARTYNLLLQNYYTIWLRAQPDEHMARVLAQGDLRPMAGNVRAMDDLRLILSEREPFYAQADRVFDTSRRSEAACVSDLTAICSDILSTGRNIPAGR